MGHYGYSRETVRAGVRVLVDEGLVVMGQGQGKYVREDYPPVVWNWTTLESRKRHETAVEGRTAGDQWASAVADEGKSPRQEISVSIVEPPKHVHAALGLPEGGLAVARKRVRYVDNRPYALADSYFPQELVSGTPLMEPRDVSAPGGVLASVGLVQAKYRDEIAVRMPTLKEAELLALPAATPVAEHTRTGYDGEENLSAAWSRSSQETGTRSSMKSMPTEYLRPAAAEDVPALMALRTEAEQWLHAKGTDQWNDPRGWRQSHQQMAMPPIDDGRAWIVVDKRVPLATVSRGPIDRDFWNDDDKPESAFYLYKLIVARSAAGQAAWCPNR